MNLLEALKTGLPARRKNSPKMSGSHGDGYIDLLYFLTYRQPMFWGERVLNLTLEDLLATDWEVLRPKKKRKIKKK